jgi:hypothetical protein
MSETETYGPVSLPTLFSWDHFTRVEKDELADVTVLRSGPKTETIIFNNLAALADFVSDARYYTDSGIASDMRQSGCGNLVNSAKRCIAKMKDAGLLEVAESSEGKAALRAAHNWK